MTKLLLLAALALTGCDLYTDTDPAGPDAGPRINELAAEACAIACKRLEDEAGVALDVCYQVCLEEVVRRVVPGCR